MNEDQAILEQQLRELAGHAEGGGQFLRQRVLDRVARQLRARRRERLAARLVYAALLLGMAGNLAAYHSENARTDRWFPYAAGQGQLPERTVLVQSDHRDDADQDAFRQYASALYGTSAVGLDGDPLGHRLDARNLAAWVDAITTAR